MTTADAAPLRKYPGQRLGEPPLDFLARLVNHFNSYWQRGEDWRAEWLDPNHPLHRQHSANFTHKELTLAVTELNDWVTPPGRPRRLLLWAINYMLVMGLSGQEEDDGDQARLL